VIFVPNLHEVGVVGRRVVFEFCTWGEENQLTAVDQEGQPLCVVYLLMLNGAAGPGPKPTPGPWMARVWPLPASITNGTSTLTVSAVGNGSAFFSIKAGGSSCPTLDAALARYAAITFPHRLPVSAAATVAAADGAAGALIGLSVSVADLGEAPPQMETDESYTLEIPAAGGQAQLTAKTVYGVRMPWWRLWFALSRGGSVRCCCFCWFLALWRISCERIPPNNTKSWHRRTYTRSRAHLRSG
jgi:hypothetical protein